MVGKSYRAAYNMPKRLLYLPYEKSVYRILYLHGCFAKCTGAGVAHVRLF